MNRRDEDGRRRIVKGDTEQRKRRRWRVRCSARAKGRRHTEYRAQREGEVSVQWWSGCEQTSRSPPPTIHAPPTMPQSIHHPQSSTSTCIHSPSTFPVPSISPAARDSVTWPTQHPLHYDVFCCGACPSFSPADCHDVRHTPDYTHVLQQARIWQGIALTYHDSCREAATAHAHVAPHHSNMLHLYLLLFSRATRRSVRCCGAQPAEATRTGRRRTQSRVAQRSRQAARIIILSYSTHQQSDNNIISPIFNTKSCCCERSTSLQCESDTV